MEVQYGIAVDNKYALFLDEDSDPLDILRQQEEAQLKKKEDKAKKDAKNEKAKSAGKNKANKKPVTLGEPKIKNVDQNANRRDTDRNRKPKPERDPFENKRPLKEGNNVPPRRQDRNERSQNDFGSDFRVERSDGFSQRTEGFGQRTDGFGQRTDGFGQRTEGFGQRTEGFGQRTDGFGPRTDGFGDNRGRGRGERGRGRGGRGRGRGGFEGGRGGFDRFGKRDFDRHSGSDKTGIKPIEKREGGGAHNWGTIKDDIEDQLNETQQSDEGQQNTDWAGFGAEEVENRDPNDSTEGEALDSPKKDESDREMTLDEWKAMQREERSAAAPKYNLRKAGEGVDEGQWKKTYALKKKANETESEESEEESEDDEYQDRRLNIEITFNDNPAYPRRGGRGGRGRGRGRGGGEFGEGRGRGRGGGGEFGEGGFNRGRGRGGFTPRGRGAERGERGGSSRSIPAKEVAPNPEDESEFPTLK